MTIYVLIACSKSKIAEPLSALTWIEQMDIKQWTNAWFKQEELHNGKNLYSGRAFQNQFELCSNLKNVDLRIISAGAGLISPDEMIPSYESTFKQNKGPDATEWHELPMGGLNNLKPVNGDEIVSFAPPAYHKALLKDPALSKICKFLVVASSSPLRGKCRLEINIHPRSKEVLGVASSDLNTKFLELYLTKGVDGFLELYKDAEKLPQKPIRSRLNEIELERVVRDNIHIGSLNKLVRHIRDELQFSASFERIRKMRFHVQTTESEE
jgi:hypothetical protein